MTIKAGHKDSNRRQNHMAKNKETSTRGAGKLQSGTHTQLVKDLQHVHKLFPSAVPDRDFYRIHGKYADPAWKEHFPRFKDFVAAARPTLTPFAAACRYFEQATKLLKQHGKNLNEQEIRELFLIFEEVGWLVPALNDYSNKVDDEIFARMNAEDEAEEKRLKQPK